MLLLFTSCASNKLFSQLEMTEEKPKKQKQNQETWQNFVITFQKHWHLFTRGLEGTFSYFKQGYVKIF